MSSAQYLWQAVSTRGRRLDAWVLASLTVVFALAVAFAIGTEQFAIAGAMVCLPLLLLAPVQMSLGVFAFAIPFNSLLLVGKEVTLSWLLGAISGPILLVYGLSMRRLQAPPRTALWWGLFAVWTCATITWAIDPEKSMERLPSVLSLFLLYVAAASIKIDARQRRALVQMTIGGGVFAALFAISQFAHGIGWLGMGVRASLVIGEREANPNEFASSLLLPLALGIGGFLAATTIWKKAIAGAAAGAIAVCILLTMSRGSLFAAAAIFFTFALRVQVRKKILIPLVLLVTPVLFLPGQFFTRLQESLTSRGQGRFDIWEVAVQIIRHYGWIGAGLENFRLAYNQFAGAAPVFRGFDRDPHNIYLQIVSETGVVGLVLFLVCVFSQLRRLARASNEQKHRNYMLIAGEAACYGLLVHGLAANILWSKHFWLAWILATIFVRSDWVTRPAAEKSESSEAGESLGFGRAAMMRGSVLMLLIPALSIFGLAESSSKPQTATRARSDYYVSPDGSDRNDGSEKRPWATIQRSANVVGPGVTVHVRPGVYLLNEVIETPVSGTREARIRFVSEPRWGAKLITTVDQAWANTGAYVDIEGFDISSATTATTIGIHSQGQFDRVIGNRIHNLPSPAGACPSGGGIMMGGGATGQSAIGNVIYDIGPPPGTCNQIHGVYAATADCTVVNNLTFHIAGKGIHLWGASTHCVVANNTSFDNQDGIVVGADPAHGGMNDGTIVANNITYRNVRYGIYEFGATGPNNQYLNNLVYDNPKPFGLLKGRAIGTVYADPQFAHYTGTIEGDYHPRPTSPAVGRGTQVSAPDSDLDSKLRQKLPGPDIGAYQSASRQ
jgi:O-antigen ligase